MPLHQNIDSSSLTDDDRLLAISELSKVSEIESFVESIRDDVRELLSLKSASRARLEDLRTQLSIAETPYDHLDRIITPQEQESEQSYRTRVLSELLTFSSLLKSTGSIDFIAKLHQTLSAIPIAADGELYECYLHNFQDIWAIHEENAPDIRLASDVGEKIVDARIERDELDERERLLKEKIALFKSEKNVDFDLNDRGELVKIFKRSREINYSIIYVKKVGEEKSTAFALYRGDEVRVLGEGGFGKVKLCQNILTGEWMAIKIQRKIMKDHSQLENAVLESLHRFGGENHRDTKYYTIQTLLPGMDLQKHLTLKSIGNVSDRIEIAKKAAELVQAFHHGFLHRDIKPENFIWDKETKALNLCDFGMACKLDSGQDKMLDLSGSGTFLAPEIDDTLHPGMVPYSTKSDVYALGKTFEKLFEGVEGVPDELRQLMDDMIKPNPNERASVDEVIARLDVIILALTTTTVNVVKAFKEEYQTEMQRPEVAADEPLITTKKV